MERLRACLGGVDGPQIGGAARLSYLSYGHPTYHVNVIKLK